MSAIIKSLDIDQMLLTDKDAMLSMANLKWNQESLPEETTIRQMHYNKPQLRSMMIGANEEYAVWGRGTGKSEGLISPRTKRNVEVMPRSHGCFVGATYMQLLERTLPPVVKGWEAMGWKKDRDFWIRQRPPKNLNIPEPIVGPLTPEHCIYFRNGAVASLVSQDRPGSANGKTVHWIAGDEAKFLDKKMLDNELLMTNRGDERFFGDIPEFHSLLFCTDMPTWKEAMWILEKEKDMDPQRVKILMAIQVEIFKLWQAYLVNEGRAKTAVFNKIRAYQKQYDQIRRNTILFSEASTWENVEGFGKRNIMKLKKSLPSFIYQTAIMNRRPYLPQEAFYPELSSERHTYDSYNYSHIDKTGFGKSTAEDSRKDDDVDPELPLHGSLDYGAHINTLAIGQYVPYGFNLVKGLDVCQPKRLRDLAKLFLDYYKHHKAKVFYFYYDHTALTNNAVSELSYADEWIALLKAGGWDVRKIYLGHTPGPSLRYEMWGKLLRGEHPNLRRVRFNRNNCYYILESMRHAKIKKGTGREEFKKNKDDERNVELDQRETTHYSDAVDTLLYGISERKKSTISAGSIIIS
jgi:hypothetical protein